MNKKSKINYNNIFYGAFVIATIGVVIMLILITQMRNQIGPLNEQIGLLEAREQDLLNQRAELTNQLDSLRDELVVLEKDYEELQERMTSTVSTTQEELQSFKTEIEESMEWFKVNSNISDIYEYKGIRSMIRGKCVDFDGDRCRVKLACFPLVHGIIKRFTYREDEKVFAKEDKLQSLTEFVQNKGGDCEDYSLVVSAELNYVHDYCNGVGAEYIEYEVADYEMGGEYLVDFGGEWYLYGFGRYLLPKDYSYHYIVCGNFPSELDPNYVGEEEYAGHCAIAFTDRYLDASDNVYDVLKNSIIVEPQSGMLIDDLRSPWYLSVPKNGMQSVYFSPDIYMVISENDLYIYRDIEGLSFWQGYADFIPKIEEMESQLIS